MSKGKIRSVRLTDDDARTLAQLVDLDAQVSVIPSSEGRILAHAIRVGLKALDVEMRRRKEEKDLVVALNRPLVDMREILAATERGQ